MLEGAPSSVLQPMEVGTTGFARHWGSAVGSTLEI